MHHSRLVASAAAFAAFSLIVTPVFAGQRGGGRNGGTGVSRGGSGGGASRGVVAAPRPSAPRGSGAPTFRGSAQSRGYSAAPSRYYGVQSRGSYSGSSRGVYSVPSRGVYSVQSHGVYSSQSRGVYAYGPHGYASTRIYAAPRHFYSPYYSFRPWLSLGFGLSIGYPIAYSYPFYYGYPYYDSSYYGGYYPSYGGYSGDPYYGMSSYPNDQDAYGSYYGAPATNYPAPRTSSSYPPPAYSNGTSPGGSVGVQRGATAGPSGGLSFEISPSGAEVYIDGRYAGHVSDLGPTVQPLALTPGSHHVEIRAAGYQTMSFDADITAGQVLPYQGSMQPER
jgi:hypothetical protein